MVEEAYLSDSFVDVPMTTQPELIGRLFLNLIEPDLCAFIYRALVDAGQEGLCRLELCGAGVGEDNVKWLVQNLLFYILFDFSGGLFILPPSITSLKAVILVHTVSSTNDQMADILNGEDLAILGEKQIGELWFVPYKATIPLFLLVCGDVGWPDLMVAVDT